MSNIRKVQEGDEINVTKYIISIDQQLARLNSKMDGFNGAIKVATNRSQAAYDLAKKNAYELKDQQTKIADLEKQLNNKADSRTKLWYAVITVSATLISGFIGNFIQR